jgi:antitoxin VapB
MKSQKKVAAARPPGSKRFRAKLFRNGGSQAVRLPKQCRLPGDEVSVTVDGKRLILEPIDGNGFTRQFVEMFLNGGVPDVVISEREQPAHQERSFEL